MLALLSPKSTANAMPISSQMDPLMSAIKVYANIKCKLIKVAIPMTVFVSATFMMHMRVVMEGTLAPITPGRARVLVQCMHITH